MKYKIASKNLIISQIVIIVFLSFAYLMWFPHSLSELNGFTKSAVLLILVNLVLGPLLILFFYKKDKKNLKFDLLALAAIQTTALLFGMYSIYQKHPVYAVFTIDRFTLVNAKYAEPEKTRHTDLQVSFLSKSKMAFAKMPTDIRLKNEITMGHMLNGEPDLDGRAEYYEPYANHINAVINKSLNLKGVLKKSLDKSELASFLNKYGGSIDSYVYIPLQTYKEDVIWVLNKTTAEPIGILNIDPWQFSKTTTEKQKPKHTIRRWLS
jgi:hypothetical protein